MQNNSIMKNLFLLFGILLALLLSGFTAEIDGEDDKKKEKKNSQEMVNSQNGTSTSEENLNIVAKPNSVDERTKLLVRGKSQGKHNFGE